MIVRVPLGPWTVDTARAIQQLIQSRLPRDGSLPIAGPLTFSPSASADPVLNGQVTIELTDDTTLTFKARGSDGVVRSAALTLA